MKKNSQSGFTLIELLVVIAIIGILASVVLASLNSARTKGADAAVKANLANARAQAELFYDTATTYLGVCANTTTGIANMTLAAAKASQGTGGSVIVNGAQTTSTSNCNDTATAWAAAVPLKGVPNSFYCVDSTGASVTTAIVIGSGDYACN